MFFVKKIATVAFLLFGIGHLYAQSPVRTMAEQMPYFAGCDTYSNNTDEKRDCSNQSIVSFIANHLGYPSSAKEAGIEGTVVVDFIIDETGEIIAPEVVYDIGGGCGQAALDMLYEMPLWEAGHQDGEAVKVKLTLPIHFSIEGPEPDESEAYQLAWGKLQVSEVSRKDLQNNLQAKVYVRDKMGNNVVIDEIIFAYERNDKVTTVRSRDGINAEMEKLVHKLKKGGTFNVTASIQDQGKFFYIDRNYVVVE